MKKVFIFGLIVFFCVSAIGVHILNESNPELVSKISQISGLILSGLILLGIIVMVIYFKFIFNPKKKRRAKTVVYILLSIAFFVLTLITLLIYALWQYFKFVTSGTFEGTATGILTLVAIVVFFILMNKIDKAKIAKEERIKREQEEEEAKKLSEEVHKRKIKSMEEEAARQRERTNASIARMQADGLSFDEMSRIMFGYDDDYDAQDPNEI